MIISKAMTINEKMIQHLTFGDNRDMKSGRQKTAMGGIGFFMVRETPPP